MKLDEEKQKALGLKGGLVQGGAVMRYVAGVVLRERERLVKIMQKHGMSEIAMDVQSDRWDDLVFKWNGPEVGLDVPAKSVEQREKEKAEKGETTGGEG